MQKNCKNIFFILTLVLTVLFLASCESHISENTDYKQPVLTEQDIPKLTDPPVHTHVKTPIPEIKKEENTNLHCSLFVGCDTIFENISLLSKDKIALIPENGIIFSSDSVIFSQGESVFDVLLREMKQNKIHFEFVNTPVYNTAYIEGINNLYEFDCGELSGWTYRVNGMFPGYGCSEYIVQSGDKIEILYTCDLGNDLGRTP